LLAKVVDSTYPRAVISQRKANLQVKAVVLLQLLRTLPRACFDPFKINQSTHWNIRL